MFISLILVISSCSKQELVDENVLTANDDKLSQANLRSDDGSVYETEYIVEYVKANAPIDWSKERDAKLLHSIGFYTDSSYIVGYKRKGFTDFENEFNLQEISKPGWKDARENILNQFNFYEGDILQNEGEGNDIFPAVLVKFSSFETMERLVAMDELYAIEPQIELFLLMFDEERQPAVQVEDPIVSRFLNEIGCDCSLPSEPNANAFDPIEPGMKMPWNYKFNGVDEYEIGEQVDPTITHAWDISTGQNIGVAVIDSGVSYEQENLDNFGAFDMVGLSFERYEERKDFLGVVLGYRQVGASLNGVPLFVTVESPVPQDGREAHDRCGHGTRQAGLVAGPRGDDGNSVGFAYNCDLYNYRAVHNPIVLTNREKYGVFKALIAAGTESNIKIISMALAQPFVDITSVFIRAGVNFADSEGKMIVCAAGTGIPGGGPLYNAVLFPANSPKTIAVTGIQYPSSYPGPLANDAICNICFAGDEVNFAVIMQDGTDLSRTTLTITCDGDIPEYSTGSSSSTGSFSGMAALVWSELGSFASREDVLQQMISASSNPHPEYQQGNISGAHPYLGNGWVNVKAALE